MAAEDEIPTNSAGSVELERTPPHDLDAERGVLGSMLISKDAISEVVEILNASCFYRPAHETIFNAILKLFSRGEPADAITVARTLQKDGELDRVGGPTYLHTLLTSVPTPASALYYAQIVYGLAMLRRLIQAGTRIVQLGYTTDGSEVEDLVNAAQAEIYTVSQITNKQDFAMVSELIEGFHQRIELNQNSTDGLVGLPTGFRELDDLTGGLQPGQMVIVAARPAMGKALALDTPLPTPTGWTTMGEVQIGDYLLDANGRPTQVVAATEVMENRPCYRLYFDDGTTIVADAEHQWLTTADGPGLPWNQLTGLVTDNPTGNAGNHPAVRTTAQIAQTVIRRAAGRPYNHSIQLCAPLTGVAELDLNEEESQTLQTKILHCLLANNTNSTLDILHETEFLRLANRALRAPLATRKSLLKSLILAVISVDPGDFNYSDIPWSLNLNSVELADWFQELAHSLGLRTICAALDNVDHWRITIYARNRRERRFVAKVVEIESVPVRCVQVDNPEHLYLASRAMIPTHNSTLAIDFCRHASIHLGKPSCVFSLEMSRDELMNRIIAAEAHIKLKHLRNMELTEDDWTRLYKHMDRFAKAPLILDDSPNLSMMEIRAKARRMKQQHGLSLIVVDYLQLLVSGKRSESRQQEVSEFSRSLKLLAKEIEVPVVAVAQLNRGPETRNDKIPMLSDLRESGSLEQDADVVILLHREDYYNPDASSRPGEADIIVAKHRNGPTRTIAVAFQGTFSKFSDLG